MFTGIVIGAVLAFWYYMIFKKYGRFNMETFQFFLICTGLPLAIWGVYKIL